MGRRKTQEEYAREVEGINPNLELASEYTGRRCEVSVKCKRCGKFRTIRFRTDNIARPCPFCEEKNGIIFGVNDLYTLRPDVAGMMEDKELAHKIAVYTHSKVWFICPFCGNRIFKSVADVSSKGLFCNACSNTNKYPNKLMFNILKNFNIDFTSEFSPDWIGKKKYDFMFNINGLKYIVEMDGAFHFTDNLMNGITKEQSEKNDKYKEDMAIEHGYIVIRIDCNYPYGKRFEHIKNNILKSELSYIFDFSDLNWIEFDLSAQRSDFEDICYLYDNVTHDINKIASEVGLSYGPVIQHLKHSEELRCSTYIGEEAKKERNELRKKKTAKSNGQMLLCIETNELFYSIASAKRLHGGNIDAHLRGERDFAGHLPNGTKLHYKRIDKNYVNDLLQSTDINVIDLNL